MQFPLMRWCERARFHRARILETAGRRGQTAVFARNDATCVKHLYRRSWRP